MELRKGQKIVLSDSFFKIKFERNAGALEIDTAAFLLQNNGKVAGDEDFVFYGNPRHVSNGVLHCDDDSIEINLMRIPSHIEKISITSTIYDAETRRQNFSKISNAALIVKNFEGKEIATFKPDTFTVETAIVLAEIYRYKGAWKFGATGAGYRGGLVLKFLKIQTSPRRRLLKFRQENHRRKLLFKRRRLLLKELNFARGNV